MANTHITLYMDTNIGAQILYTYSGLCLFCAECKIDTLGVHTPHMLDDFWTPTNSQIGQKTYLARKLPEKLLGPMGPIVKAQMAPKGPYGKTFPCTAPCSNSLIRIQSRHGQGSVPLFLESAGRT